jgi:hypothetical protein
VQLFGAVPDPRWHDGPVASGVDQAPARHVYRPAMVRIAAAVYVVFAGWWLLSALFSPSLRGDAPVLGLALLAGGALVYALFWRPAVIVDAEGVELRNVLRDVRVPWAALQDVDTKYTLTLHAGGRRHQSWAASTRGWTGIWRGPAQGVAPGHSPDPQSLPGQPSTRSSRDLRADSGAAAFLVEQRWAGWRDALRPGSPHPPSEAGAVVVRWNVAAPAIVVAGTVLAVVLRYAGV